MKYSLRTKLVLSYVMVALVCVSLISALSNVFFEKHFKEYIIENQERKNKEIVSLMSQQYLDNGKWNGDMIEKIGINALEQGMIVKVTDNTGKVIWDAKVHNNGLCQQMIEHMSHNMMSRYPNWKGAYIENPYSITSDFKGVGKVEIGYYGPYYFTDHDLAFINALNRVLIWVGVFSLVFAFLIGVLMARRLSNPITKVTGAARMIANGYFGGRVTETSSTKEISQLTGTINNLAETLEKQEILRKRLTGDVAHELRTPLATLQSHMEAMIDGIWKPDTERLKSCHEEIMRISRMVGDLEKLAKYESENLVLNKTEFDVSELISHIVKNFETDFVNKNITLNFSAVKEIIFADKDKISQVIVNLISNALKYTRETGSVEIEVLNEENTSKIGIRDTGSGISAEDLPLIFERFYRADRSRNRLTGGSGIGLTITKAIVEAHKGKIEVKSEVNKGTEFTVVLPKSID
jgi:two-component system, OmpR family, sensor histidine kinase BaeS